MEGASCPCFIAIISPPRLLRTGKSPRPPICDALRSQGNEDDGNDDDDDTYNRDLIYNTKFTPNFAENGDMAFSPRRGQSHEGGKSVDADMGALRRRLASQLICILKSQQIRPPQSRARSDQLCRCPSECEIVPTRAPSGLWLPCLDPFLRRGMA